MKSRKRDFVKYNINKRIMSSGAFKQTVQQNFDTDIVKNQSIVLAFRFCSDHRCKKRTQDE